MLGVAIIGYGNIGRSHSEAVDAMPETRLVCAADISESARDAFESAHNIPCYEEASDALTRDDVDVAIICLPHDLHASFTIQALESGKHVLCEKPMALSLEECDAMNDAAARSARMLMIGMTWHFNPSMIALRDVISSGQIGRPIFGEDILAKNWGFSGRSEWFKARSRGGGMWLANGIHQIDRLSWLMGDRIQTVDASTGTFQHVQDADDMTMASVRFSEGAFASIACFGFAQGGDRQTVTVWGTDGAVRFHDGVAQIGRDGAWESIDAGTWNPLQRELEDFVKSVNDDARSPVDGEWGRYTVAVALGAELSSRIRSPTAVDRV